MIDNGLPQFEGSNAWVIAGSRSQSGKPLLAGDPHIRFSVPSVWYEAQLSAPGFELYGHHQALVPFAFLGHNLDFGWSLTMFQNDDLDLIAEKVNPDNPNQVWYRGQWTDMVTSEQQINGEGPDAGDPDPAPVAPRPDRQRCPRHRAGKTPIAMWWAFLETPNPILEGFYQLNRADTLAKARAAAAKVQAPGLNLVYANAKGDIAWWASALLPKRPAGVQAGLHPRRQQRSGGQGRFLPVQRQPAGREPGARLHRLGQLPAAVADRHGDSRLLQPGRSRPAAQSPAQRQKREVEQRGQPETATGHHHRLRPAHCWRHCCRYCVKW